jgi:hypothetical protein
MKTMFGTTSVMAVYSQLDASGPSRGSAFRRDWRYVLIPANRSMRSFVTLTTFHNFDGTDGGYPLGLVQSTNGGLYGPTAFDGTNGDGTVFSLSVDLGPFVKTLPTSGKVGALVKILGNALTTTTSVSFNGTEAEFKVVSATEIETNVPTGATTGSVTQ